MTLRKANASISNAQDLTAQDIQTIKESLGLSIPILTEYPTTDATKVGQKFIYRGNEWKYHSQAELDDLGWTTVSEGFPAPVSKVAERTIAYNGDLSFTFSGNFNFVPLEQFNKTYIVDFLGFGDPSKISILPQFGGQPGASSTVTLKNASLLLGLEDLGTFASFRIYYANLTDVAINELFTDLPPTTKTATINVSNNPGSATCDPTIATAKGYTVVT